MSRENVEIVRAFYVAFNERDVAAITHVTTEAFEWHPNPDDPEQRVLRSRDDVLAQLNELWGSLTDLRTEPVELVDAGDRVVAVVQHQARMPGARAVVERREAHLWTLDEGRAVMLREFPERAEALEAVGLRE